MQFGGREVTTAIMRHLNLTFSKAEAIKFRYGVMVDEARTLPSLEGGPDVTADGTERLDSSDIAAVLQDIVLPSLEKLEGELKKLVTYCAAEIRGVRVDKLILFGGGSLMKNLDRYLAMVTGMEVVVCDSLGFASGTDGERADGTHGPESSAVYGTAAGLALRDFLN